MCRAARDVVQIEREGLEPRLGCDELLQVVEPDAQQLRLQVGRLRLEVGGELLHLLLHALRTRLPRVLVREHPGVDGQAGNLLIQP